MASEIMKDLDTRTIRQHFCKANYVPVKQGSKQWHASRIGIITASKIPYLLGFHGQKEFEHAWFCIHNNVDESKAAPKRFKNFSRGTQFGERAVKLFEDISGVLTVLFPCYKDSSNCQHTHTNSQICMF